MAIMPDLRIERRARIEAVVGLARKLSDPSTALGGEARSLLRETSGLSDAGVELALGEHLETDPREADLAGLLDLFEGPEAAARGAGSARCHVVLSATVPVAAVRAIALAAAASPVVSIKPSRRDPGLAHLLARELVRDRAFGANVTTSFELSARRGDAVHAYGSDQTLEAIGRELGPGIALWGHGHGFGIAVISSGGEPTERANALARDVIPFDQQGCLSPRLVLIDANPADAAHFARALAHALGRLERGVPRGSAAVSRVSDESVYAEAMRSAGELFGAPGSLVGLDSEPRDVILPPPTRAVHVIRVGAAQATAILSPLAHAVAAIGMDGDSPLSRAITSSCPGARASALGAMQRPPLDGPVDRRGLLPSC